MRHPREVSYYQYNRHGFREVLDVMRGKAGGCRCSMNMPIVIDAPFYHFSHLPYDPVNNRYDVTGYCIGCRKKAVAAVRAELMPLMEIDGLAQVVIGLDDEFCNHRGTLFMTHLIHDWEDSEKEDHYRVICRRCKAEVDIDLSDDLVHFERYFGDSKF